MPLSADDEKFYNDLFSGKFQTPEQKASSDKYWADFEDRIRERLSDPKVVANLEEIIKTPYEPISPRMRFIRDRLLMYNGEESNDQSST